MKQRKCTDHPDRQPKIDASGNDTHLARWVCPECDRFLGWVGRRDLDFTIALLQKEIDRLNSIVERHSVTAKHANWSNEDWHKFVLLLWVETKEKGYKPGYCWYRLQIMNAPDYAYMVLNEVNGNTERARAQHFAEEMYRNSYW